MSDHVLLNLLNDLKGAATQNYSMLYICSVNPEF